MAWYLRSLRDGFWVVGGDFNVTPIDFKSRNHLRCMIRLKVGMCRSGAALSEND